MERFKKAINVNKEPRVFEFLKNEEHEWCQVLYYIDRCKTKANCF